MKTQLLNESLEQLAHRYNISVRAMREHLRINARQIFECYIRAAESGKKYRGKTAEQWHKDYVRYSQKINS